jgi:7,8-dihydroneopterin aldolase/epimerase/oxygenase
MSEPPLDEITLRGMKFYTRVGVLPHEQHVDQRLEVDLTAWVSSEDILDYQFLYDDVRAVIEGPVLDYLERIGDRIAQRVLQHAQVQRVRITLRKPEVSLGGPLQYAGVSVVRERASFE